VAERRGRLSPGAALAATLKLRSLPLGTGNYVSIIDVALRHSLSGCDASYITLARACSNAHWQQQTGKWPSPLAVKQSASWGHSNITTERRPDHHVALGGVWSAHDDLCGHTCPQ
jgi:hypothetical protein